MAPASTFPMNLTPDAVPAGRAALRGVPRVWITAVALALLIFCLDAFTKDDLAVAGLYVLVVLIAAGGGNAGRRVIIGWASSCAVLALLGYTIFQERGAGPLAGLHLLISLTVLIVTTLLLLRAQGMYSAVERGEQRYRTIFDTLAIAIWEHDFTPVKAAIADLRANGVTDLRRYLAEHPDFVAQTRRMVRITDVNATALAMMGVASKQAFFSHLSGFLPETDESFADCILAIDERRALFQAEATVLPMNGEPRHIIVAFGLGPEASLDRVPGSILDITHRRALEAQVSRTREELAEAHRASALGAMSASIAHELNQPMSAIHSYAEAARRWMAHVPPNMGEATDALAGLGQAVEHARSVMQRVRTLVSQARVERSDLDLGQLVATTVALMRHEAADAGARIAVVGTDAALPIRGDRILLKQVLVNLIANAIEAMQDIPPQQRLVTVDLRADGDAALLQVRDQGPGWDEAVRSRAFTSFFTTKANGMGLGLAISQTAVERHGGRIELGDAPEGGAVVAITLPLSAGAPASAGERILDRGEQFAAVERFGEQGDDLSRVA
jgi:two-component system, LuxR family, sensor kinase FixL